MPKTSYPKLNSEALDYFREARAKIKKGWFKQHVCPDHIVETQYIVKREVGSHYCLVTALRDYTKEAQDWAMIIAAEHLPKWFRDLESTQELDPWGQLVAFNDLPTTTHRMVLGVIDRTIRERS